jgi:thiosulfate reductase cytochrome b subunit
LASLADAELPKAIEWQQRHSLVTRTTHWLRLVCIVCLIGSGLQIFNAYPRLHWGKAGSEHDAAWLEIGAMGTPAKGMLRIGDLTIETTGTLGLSFDEGQPVMLAFPGEVTIPGVRDLASGRRWHFFWAWVFVLNGLLYLGLGLASGKLQAKMFPTRAELAPAHLWHEIKEHARFRFPRSEGALAYNAIQKLTYLGVLFVLLPLMVLTGLTMSPSVTATLPIADLFGGRQSARSLHFIAMWLLVGFIIVHVGLVLFTGFRNLMRSMVTGKFAYRKGEW